MPNFATLLQTICAALCAILCALSGMGGGGMMIGAFIIGPDKTT